eukprot:Nitzschia sp. Nitz4//scaffold237_size30108//20525//21908//NITZ4_007994-RA/size30108-augustus-gene-0.37-mRNA-1//1//CDS//3329543512//3323//frame0
MSSSVPIAKPASIPSILGTWTFQTKASSDLGYYKGSAFFVMHVMPDPLNVYQCRLSGCHEVNNQICQQDQCVNISNTISEWSDVAVFYQFGFDVVSGTYPWRKQIVQNTSDWLGPYSLVLAKDSIKRPKLNSTKHQIKSRYVLTAATDYLRVPINDTITTPESQWFDRYAGESAVRASIQSQANLEPGQDPYRDTNAYSQLSTATRSIRPILPRFQVDDTSRFQLDFPILSLSEPDDPLYHIWPALQYHLPDFPVLGPYYWDGDSKAGYAISLSWDSNLTKGFQVEGIRLSGTNSSTWDLTIGCVAELPCWPHEKPAGGGGGGDGGNVSPNDVWNIIQTYGVFVLLVAFVLSLTLNCQLSYQLQQSGSGSDRRSQSRRVSQTITSLEEPLLDDPSHSLEGASDVDLVADEGDVLPAASDMPDEV